MLSGVQNFHLTVKENEGRIIFLRQVEEGAADRSYGIEVARLAGMPHSVTARAREILKKHEETEHELSDNLTRARHKKRIVIGALAGAVFGVAVLLFGFRALAWPTLIVHRFVPFQGNEHSGPTIRDLAVVFLPTIITYASIGGVTGWCWGKFRPQ